jgi:hypothetical protein
LRTDEAERSRASRVDAFHAAHLDRSLRTDNGHFRGRRFLFVFISNATDDDRSATRSERHRTKSAFY